MLANARPSRLRRFIAIPLLTLLAACTSSSPSGQSPSLTLSATGSVGSPSASPSPSPSRTPPPLGSGPIGYVGCSNSAASVNGYHLGGGDLFWPFIRNYGGGTVTQWADGIGQNGNQYWSAFTKQQEHDPAHVFWFQLCATALEDQDNDDEALAVIAEIRRRAPDAVIYISALNDWVAPHICSICGADGPANMEADAAEVIAAGEALEGPVMPALIAQCNTRDECGVSSTGATIGNNQVETDGCHPNPNGQLRFGATLERFFG